MDNKYDQTAVLDPNFHSLQVDEVEYITDWATEVFGLEEFDPFYVDGTTHQCATQVSGLFELTNQLDQINIISAVEGTTPQLKISTNSNSIDEGLSSISTGLDIDEGENLMPNDQFNTSMTKAELIAENNDLKRELNRLQNILHNKDVELLRMYKALADAERELVSFKLNYNDIDELAAKIKGIENYYVTPYSYELPTHDPNLLARIDGLIRNRDDIRFVPRSYELLCGYFGKNKTGNVDFKRIMNYVHDTNYIDFLMDFYSSKTKGWNNDDFIRHAISMHAGFNGSMKPSDIIDAFSNRYEFNSVGAVSHGVLLNDKKPLKCNSDYIFGRHSIGYYELSILHLLSHLNPAIKGSDLAKYHVGNACRISECSLISVLGTTKYYKPIKCSGEYVIMQRLPNEENNRVKCIIVQCGVTYVDFVRTLDFNDSENIVLDVSKSVSCMLRSCALTSVNVGFSNDGLCIKAEGSRLRNLDLKMDFDCCKKAFILNGQKQRYHKHINNRN